MLSDLFVGDLNVIVFIIFNFFLMFYVFINYFCFDVLFVDFLGFRFSFKYYNMWISFVGVFLCIVVMFLINWWVVFIMFVVVGFFYFYV